MKHGKLFWIFFLHLTVVEEFKLKPDIYNLTSSSLRIRND
jgi:hypothetical protein